MSQQTKEQFNLFLQKELNKHQLAAATQKDGALLVIAGAGSGKTRVITSRIANLIVNENVDPRSIVALTFTNKAAGEMKERIMKFVGAEYSMPFVGTFHSYCLLLLRTNPTLLPFPSFSIMDSDDQTSLIKKIIKTNALEKYATPYQISFQISSIKNKLYVTPQAEDLYSHPIIKQIYLAYEIEKAASHSFDFDDLLLQVLDLFKKNKEFKTNFQKRIRHVLVDEYQDTSDVQHLLLKEIAICPKNKFNMDSLCAVGDEDQSIYSWRGATVANMLKFKSDFKPVTTVKIEQNYRSVKPILDAANSVISCNKLRNPKTLWSDKKAKNRILLLSCRSGEQEAEAISNFLKILPANKKSSNIAILYRTHFQSRSIEESLIYHGIPYRIIGGIRFYERKEIKDLLAYLRLIINPFDKISLLRIINTPSRGLGAKFEEQLLHEWTKNPMLTFDQILNHLCTSTEIRLTANKVNALQSFLGYYKGLNRDGSPTELIDTLLEKTDYLNYLRTAYDGRESETKIENVRELVQSIYNFEQNFNPKTISVPIDDPFYIEASKPTLENFLYEVSLMQEKSESDNTDEQVQMMTLHAAKGLEFDTVIITGLEEGLLPSSRSLNTTEALEEERRLFYVGITRAREHLVMLHASYRRTYGQISDQVISRFADEIKKGLLTEINIEERNGAQQKSIISKWFGGKTQDNNILTFSSFKPTQSVQQRYRSNKKISGIRKKTDSIRHTTSNRKPVTNRKYRPKSFVGAQSIGAKSMGPWKKNDQVAHTKFGTGIITKVEKANGDDYYITAIFKDGQKKILSSFLKHAIK